MMSKSLEEHAKKYMEQHPLLTVSSKQVQAYLANFYVYVEENRVKKHRIVGSLDPEFQILVDWLSQEYSEEDAVMQLEAATIEKHDGGLYIIVYDSNQKDVVRIENGVVEHLNPLIV